MTTNRKWVQFRLGAIPSEPILHNTLHNMSNNKYSIIKISLIPNNFSMKGMHYYFSQCFHAGYSSNLINIKLSTKSPHTVEFKGFLSIFEQALGIGQIEWASKKKSPIVRT